MERCVLLSDFSGDHILDVFSVEQEDVKCEIVANLQAAPEKILLRFYETVPCPDVQILI